METGRAGERFRVLEPALPPEGPAAPNRLRLLIMGLLVALAAAGAAVMAREQFDTAFHSERRDGARTVRHGVPFGRRAPRLHRGAGARLDPADRPDAGRTPRARRVRDSLRAGADRAGRFVCGVSRQRQRAAGPPDRVLRCMSWQRSRSSIPTWSA